MTGVCSGGVVGVLDGKGLRRTPQISERTTPVLYSSTSVHNFDTGGTINTTRLRTVHH